MSAISAMSTATTAYAQLRKYQQKLSSDQSEAGCVANAVAEDQAAVSKATQAIRQVDECAESTRPAVASTRSTGKIFDLLA
jgi:hypothetical protein